MVDWCSPKATAVPLNVLSIAQVTTTFRILQLILQNHSLIKYILSLALTRVSLPQATPIDQKPIAAGTKRFGGGGINLL